MNFPPALLDEIRERLSVSSVVSRRVKLIKRGREFVGLSPFTNEKTPSFTVNDEKGFYHCFSSGEHGDIFTFLMKTQGLAFPEAVERLAEEAGVEMPRQDARQIEEITRATKLREAVDAACMFFQAALQKPEGKRALEYLRGRGLGDEIIQKYRLGYAPSGNALKNELKRRGFAEDVLLENRLISPGQEGRDSFDFFRDRVMFPILDARGRPVAFGGRVLGEGEPKYLNSPETPLFHKGGLLYGLSLARPAINDKGQAIVCEGYMDVIALAQAGFANAVAPLGTALTETQLDLLWKLVPEPIMCFDGDKAGQRAAARVAALALPKLLPGKSLQFALLPSGQDPDDLVRRSGPEAMTQVLNGAIPLSEVIWRQVLAEHPVDTPERRAGFERAVLDKASAIADTAVRDQYRMVFRDRLRAMFQPQRQAWGKGGWTPKSGGRKGFRPKAFGAQPGSAAMAPRPLASRGLAVDVVRERILLATLLNHPGILGHVEDRLGAMVFADSRLDSVRQSALMHLAHQPDLDSQTLRAHLDGLGYGRELDALLGQDTYVHAAFARPQADLTDATKGWDHTFSLCERSGLETDFRQAQAEFVQNPTEESFSALKSLAEQLDQSTHDQDHEITR
ncbi:MAG: DNA primase [Rhodospirillaceae bacterium]|nr:DNA primase [Rhodospirillaceae bacterium]